jgi:hypothetical protein
MSIMGRAVYIGGFGNGKSCAEYVASALDRYYEDVDLFTFSEAMASPDDVRKAVHGVNVVTHSAGMLAVKGTRPNRIDAFSPPLPTTIPRLLARTGLKTVRMHTPGIGLRSVGDIPAVNRYDRSVTAELLTHPEGNFGRLGAISQFDAVRTAISAQESGIRTSLTYTTGDEYYHLSEEGGIAATIAGVSLVTTLSGVHDELVLRPAETLEKAMAGYGA